MKKKKPQYWGSRNINLLNPTGHVMHQQI